MESINIMLNGEKKEVANSLKLSELLDYIGVNIETDLVYVKNGYAVDGNSAVADGDNIVIADKTKIPSETELEIILGARNSPEVRKKLKRAKVGIAGLGGLGSNVAVMLARLGVGTIFVADFDIVEPTNLNRQQYFINQLGKFKTTAICDLIGNINPYIKIEAYKVKLNEQNSVDIFKNCDVVCECFDNAECKAWFAECILTKLDNVKLVSSSGMAGLNSANEILTRKISDRFYVCGDLKSDAAEFNGLMSPRVSVCAGHQANAVLELLIN